MFNENRNDCMAISSHEVDANRTEIYTERDLGGEFKQKKKPTGTLGWDTYFKFSTPPPMENGKNCGSVRFFFSKKYRLTVYVVITRYTYTTRVSVFFIKYHITP